MARVHRQWRQHWKSFFLKIFSRPGRAPDAELRYFPDADFVLLELGQQFLVKEIVLRRDQFVREPLDLVERFRRTQSVRRDVARFAFNLLFDPGDADLEKL